MAYTLIYGQNGNTSITVADGESNTVGNLTFPGRNFSGYGSPVDQNFLSMAENFASSNTGPQNPLTGQLWFDTGTATTTLANVPYANGVDSRQPTAVFTNLRLTFNAANTSGNSDSLPAWYSVVYADTKGNVSLGSGNISANNITASGVLAVTGASTLNGAVTTNATLSVGTNLTVGGSATIGNGITITGNANISNNINVTGNANISNNISVTGDANITGNVTIGSGSSNLRVNGSIHATGSITNDGGTFTIGGELNVEDPVILVGFDQNNNPVVTPFDAAGLAFTYSGITKSELGNASSGSNVINVVSTANITPGMRIGANVIGIPIGSIVGNIINSTSVDITDDNGVRVNTTAAIVNGSNITFGLSYNRFLGWDNTGSEFAFLSNANIKLSTNYIGTTSSSDYGAIHFGTGTAEGTLTAKVGITSNGSIVLPINAGVMIIGNTGVTSNATAANIKFYGDGSNIYNLDLGKSNFADYLANNSPSALTVTGNVSGGNLNISDSVIADDITANTSITAPTFNGNLVGNVSGNIVGTSGNFQTLRVIKDSNPNTAAGLEVRYITTGSTGTTGNIVGTWTLDSGSYLEACFADLAERHHSDREYATGTVMTVGGANEVTAAADGDRVLGVVSEKYAYLMNGDAGPQETHPAVAYLGRLPVRVVGPVNKHDVISPLADGVAVASKSNGFGWALETNSEPGEKLVLCIIK